MSLKTFLTVASVLLCLCGTCFGVENGPSDVRVSVKEGSDAVLPCSLKNQNLNSALFDWNKEDPNGQKGVFMCDAGTNNSGHDSQHPQFRDRVSHFGDELQHGNASIKIHNTKVEDSGNYTCKFPRFHPEQIFHVELVVDWILKDRSGSPGVALAPYIKTVNASDNWSLLQCDVRDASPKPVVEWKNGDGKVLHTQEPQVTESKGRYDVSLLTTVYQTGLYRCVVKQEELHHQLHSETYVHISGSENSCSGWQLISGFVGLVIGWLTFAFAIGVIIFVAPKRILAVVRRCSTDGLRVVNVFVEEGGDVVLKCSPGNLDLTARVFDWRKVDHKDLQKVFLYDAGKIYNNGHSGQDQQFKGRVSHFGDELQHGNASIKIHNTKVEDSGNYTCYFPYLDPPQIVRVELVVDDSNGRLLNSSNSKV